MISLNSAVAACDRSQQWELALELFDEMSRRKLEAGGFRLMGLEDCLGFIEHELQVLQTCVNPEFLEILKCRG